MTFTLSTTNFQKIHEDDHAAMQLYFAGELKVVGDQMRAMKLSKLLDTCRG
ncbi:SCP2 sterol-binding domain-containing protein [Streptomyces sp. NPDC059740]|uniref:SCP2 sterol-binding domain-containing protein n=1 Tax=Streptomyces sp. NPDC059740 TaxID=3346926 RepID=UPI003648F6A3